MTGQSSRRAATFGIALAGLTALGACAPGDYTAPGFSFLTRYQAAPGNPVLLTNAQWWKGLGDPLLDDLIDAALRDNIGLGAARERVTAAQAAREAVPRAAILSASAGVSAAGADGSDLSSEAPLQLGLNWMLDPWGGRRSRLRAEAARADIAAAERDAAQLLLIYNTANTYLELRYSQTLLTLSRREQGERRRTLARVGELERAGEATSIDITRSEARLAEIAAELPSLTASETAAMNQLAVLLGTAPGTLPASLSNRLKSPAPLPRPRLDPQVGIPADLLRNRPDIRIAERRYAIAVADIGSTRAAAYPSLSLGGAIALDAIGGGTDYFFGPALQLPDLNPATAKAAISGSEASARAAHEDWHATVLGAILEVENALSNYGALTASSGSAAKATRLYERARDLTRDLFDHSEATYSELVDAEESVSESQRRLARQDRDRARAFVDLNTRIGAGNSAAPSQTAQ